MKKLFVFILLIILTLSLSACRNHDSEGFEESIMHALGMFGSSKTNLTISSVDYVYYGADYEGTRVVFYIYAITYREETDKTDQFALLFTQNFEGDLSYDIEKHDAYENMMTNYNEYVRIFKENPLELEYSNAKMTTSKLTLRQIDFYLEKAIAK